MKVGDIFFHKTHQEPVQITEYWERTYVEVTDYNPALGDRPAPEKVITAKTIYMKGLRTGRLIKKDLPSVVERIEQCQSPSTSNATSAAKSTSTQEKESQASDSSK